MGKSVQGRIYVLILCCSKSLISGPTALTLSENMLDMEWSMLTFQATGKTEARLQVGANLDNLAKFYLKSDSGLYFYFFVYLFIWFWESLFVCFSRDRVSL